MQHFVFRLLGITFIVFSILFNIAGYNWVKYLQAIGEKDIKGYRKMIRIHKSLLRKQRAVGAVDPKLKLYTLIFLIPYYISTVSLIALVLLMFFRKLIF